MPSGPNKYLANMTVKSLGRRGMRQLTRRRWFQSKPLLAPLLRTFWRYLRAPTPEAGAAAVRALAMSQPSAYPILFRDRHDLEYVLYPGQNAEIYLASIGNYEIGETEFCVRRIRPGMTAFDVGANIGLYTLLFAKCAGPTGRVHAFEPEPRNFGRLLVNLAINRLENVTANQSAVFARSEPLVLNVYPEAVHALHSLGRASVPHPTEPGRMLEPECRLTVPAASLDDYCAGHGIDRIDYLKIDVEGAELDVLRGSAGLLARRAIGLIQFEALPSQANDSAGDAAGGVFGLLNDHGFRCHPIGRTGQLLPEASAACTGYTNYAALGG